MFFKVCLLLVNLGKYWVQIRMILISSLYCISVLLFLPHAYGQGAYDPYTSRSGEKRGGLHFLCSSGTDKFERDDNIFNRGEPMKISSRLNSYKRIYNLL